MKKYWVACWFVLLVLIAYANTYSQPRTNDLIEAMLDSLLVRVNYDGKSDTFRSRPLVVSAQNVFFAGDGNWSETDKRAVFDWYLANLHSTAKVVGRVRGVLMRDNAIAEAAISQCEAMDYTNAFESIRGNALGSGDPSRLKSIALAVKWSDLDGRCLDLIERIVTNETEYSRIERNLAYRLYCERLTTADGLARTNGLSWTSGVDAMYSSRTDVVGAVAIDKMLVECREGYSNGTDRLECALDVLSNTNAMSNCLRYFAGVTNTVANLSD